MAAPTSSGASPHDIAPFGNLEDSSKAGSPGNGRAEVSFLQEHQSPPDTAFLASRQFCKIKSNAQQALAQCMELGLHVLPIQRAEQRDILAAKLLEAAYLGLRSALSSGPDMGFSLPSLAALAQLTDPPSPHMQELVQHQQQSAHNGMHSTSVQRPSALSAGQQAEVHESQPSGTRSDSGVGAQDPEHTSLAPAQRASEMVNGSLKRRAESSTRLPDQNKRQRAESGLPDLSTDSSPAARISNSASLVVHLEQEVSQDLAQWEQTRDGSILEGISAKIEGTNSELANRAAEAEPPQTESQAIGEQQAYAAALAKIDAVNARLAQAGVAQQVATAVAPSVSDALAAKFAAANAGFMQVQPGASPAQLGSFSAQPGTPLPASASAAGSAGLPDAARLAALDAKLAQFPQLSPAPATSTSVSDSLALLDAKLALYGPIPAAPVQHPTNGVYQPSLLGYAAAPVAGRYTANGAGVMPGAGMVGTGMPGLAPVPGGWQAGSMGMRALGPQLAWQPPPMRGIAPHLAARPPPLNNPQMNPLPGLSAQNVPGMHPTGAQPQRPGPPTGPRPLNTPDAKTRLQQEALARLQHFRR